jgi:hypothetical protein
MRHEALKNLLELNGSVSSLVEAVQAFPWDADAALVTFTRAHMRAALQKYRDKALDAEQLEDWANAIECREDVGFEAGYEDMLQEAIFQLANPLLTLAVTDESARLLVAKLA